ncbi:uncharacterized protein LOC21407230 [Morus notabilis]|uniref:uncharacterized protein LOC21407230 n=1 Tax=Morus notabilis TaxID=981085 RepID=UPI000CED60A9|nr:uncharacterized protein LOC21407230 [Morus notabilis]
MGCFPACFTSSSTSKRRKRHNSDQGLQTTEAVQQIEPAKRESVGELIKLIRESKEEVEEQVSCAAKKRVTFDLNVKSYEELSAKEVACDLVDGKEEKRSGNEEEAPKEIEPILDTIALSKVACFTPSNRYQNCRKSTDESEDLGLEGIDLEEDDDDGSYGADDKEVVVQEESSESLFSLSIDSRKRVCDAEKGEKEVNSPMPIRSFSEEEVKTKTTGSCRNAGKRCHFGDSVLSPIENFTQRKEVKKRPVSTFIKHQEKENISLEKDVSIFISPEPSLRSSKLNSSEMKHATEQEIGVDTSLSSWLVGSETTVKSIASDNHSVLKSESEEERELKQVSALLSPTRSRSHSPDATPEIGTVGSYWVHTRQNMDPDSSSSGKRISIPERENRKDQAGSCNSTPFDARLGRALDTGVC